MARCSTTANDGSDVHWSGSRFDEDFLQLHLNLAVVMNISKVACKPALRDSTASSGTGSAHTVLRNSIRHMCSQEEVIHIQSGFLHDVRSDGRCTEELRPIVLETGQLVQASGSARLKLGLTDVLVAVKVRRSY